MRGYFVGMLVGCLILAFVPGATDAAIGATCYAAPILVAPGVCS